MIGLVVLLAATAISAAISGVAQDPPAIDCGDRTDHPQIHISEDHGLQGFTWTDPVSGETEHRPGSGVVAGDGSPEDPFLIQAWCIELDVTALNAAIHIEETTRHVVIVDNVVLGPGAVALVAGLQVENALNVVLLENTVTQVRDGAWVTASPGIVVKGNQMSANAGDGVHLSDTQDASVEENSVTENENGIQVISSSRIELRGNTAVGQRAHGIALTGSMDVIFQENLLSTNVGKGIFVLDSQDVLVEGNEADGNADGIHVEESVDVLVRQNLLAGGEYGVGAWRSDKVTMLENAASGAGTYGLYAAEVVEAVFDGNILEDNQNGIGVGASHEAMIEGNTISGSVSAGIASFFSEGVQVQNNMVENNDGGISFFAGSNNASILDNWVSDHHSTGIAFDGSTGGLVQGNVVEGSGGEGIIFWSSSDGTAIGNVVTDNGHRIDRYGIRMAVSQNGRVEENIVTGNANGMAFDSVITLQVHRNSVTDNDEKGMIFWTTQDVSATYNQISGNDEGIEVVQESEGMALHWNNILANLNQVGVNATQADHPVDARENWWGCPGGPMDAACEEVIGDVDVTPWLQGAVPIDGLAPVWEPVADLIVGAGELVEFTVEAEHPLGQTIALSSDALPAGATFSQLVDDPGVATGSFSWTPSMQQVAVHELTFVATAGSSESTLSVLVTVQPIDPPQADVRLSVMTSQPLGLSPGDEVTLWASVRNLDPTPVVVPLSVSASTGWNVSVGSELLALEAGEEVQVPVEVVVGEGSLFSRVTLKAQVQGVPDVQRQVTWSLTVPVSVQVEMLETTVGSAITGEVFVHYADGSPVVGAQVTGVRSNGWDMTGVMQDSFGGATNETGRLGFSFSPTDLAAQMAGTHMITADANVADKEFRGFISYQVGV